MTILEPAIKAHFRPEFINRLDEVLPFLPLKEDELEAITVLQLEQVKQRLFDQKIDLKWTHKLVRHLALGGYDPAFGARPLKRHLVREVINPLANALLKGKVHSGQTVNLDVADGALKMTM